MTHGSHLGFFSLSLHESFKLSLKEIEIKSSHDNFYYMSEAIEVLHVQTNKRAQIRKTVEQIMWPMQFILLSI